jgi:GNAT superfamily N-acetyltransferase
MVRHHDKTHKGKIKEKRFVFEEDGDIIVCAGYSQFIDAYHPQKFIIYIHVNRDHINKGYGGASFNFLMKQLQQFDPIKITSEVNEIHPRGIRFLKDRGFTVSMKEQESQLDLTAYKPEKYQKEIHRALNQGFRIITLSQFRKENKKADYKCWQFERLVAPDMPWTDPITVPEFDYYKEYNLTHPRFNPDSWFIVLDVKTIVGINNLWKTSMEKTISTGLTGVLRKYRRKGIATALKHTNLAWAKNQGYESIRTNNADSNEGMLSINLKIGFKFMPAWLVLDKIIKEKK